MIKRKSWISYYTHNYTHSYYRDKITKETLIF